MENLCHTLAGVVLARAGLDRTTPLATATLVLASNLPDVDILTVWWGDLAYLEHHRGITHSVLGLALQGPILAGAVVLFDRLARLPRRPGAEPARFGRLLVVALVGLFVHLLLDWTNMYGVRPLLPFAETWFYGDIVFIVDPWLWLVLGGALFVSARQGWLTNVVWGLVFAAMAAAVTLSLGLHPDESGGIVAVAIWAILLVGLLAARARWPDAPAQALSRAALVGVVGYWALLGLAHAAAARELETVHRGQGSTVVAAPTLMRPDRWRGYSVTDTEIRASQVLLGRGVRDKAVYDRNLDDPRVQAALRTCPGSVALAFNRLLYAEVTRADDAGDAVALRDARFATVPGRPDFATTTVPLDVSGDPAADNRPCPRGVWPW